MSYEAIVLNLLCSEFNIIEVIKSLWSVVVVDFFELVFEINQLLNMHLLLIL